MASATPPPPLTEKALRGRRSHGEGLGKGGAPQMRPWGSPKPLCAFASPRDHLSAPGLYTSTRAHNTHRRTTTAACSRDPGSGNALSVPPHAGRHTKHGSVHTMERHLAVREGSSEDVSHRIPLTGNVRNRQTHRNRKRTGWPGAGVGRRQVTGKRSFRGHVNDLESVVTKPYDSART